MKRTWKTLPILGALLLLLIGCVWQVPATQPQETVQSLDLWTAAPTAIQTEDAAPIDLSTAAPTIAALEEPDPTAAPTVTATPTAVPTVTPTPSPTPLPIDEDGIYDSKDEVALYLHVFGHLPSNYITKKDAQALGWPGYSLEPYAPGKCIGGDRFRNAEGLLPEAKGRTYYECDIGTRGKSSRGKKRIVWSNDGLIYYTDDHYNSFTRLYGGE